MHRAEFMHLLGVFNSKMTAKEPAKAEDAIKKRIDSIRHLTGMGDNIPAHLLQQLCKMKSDDELTERERIYVEIIKRHRGIYNHTSKLSGKRDFAETLIRYRVHQEEYEPLLHAVFSELPAEDRKGYTYRLEHIPGLASDAA